MSDDPGNSIKQALPGLLILALICLALIMTTVELTDDRIADNRQRTILRVMGDIIPAPYNSDPLNETTQVTDVGVFGNSRPVRRLTARQNGRIQGFVFLPVTAQGYNGPIRLAVGVNRNGELSGVRVLEQHETPGLGAGVDQSVSDWINMFAGRSFDNTPPAMWTVRKNGGEFDQLSGATITSRGVINSVRNVLDYFHLNKQRLLEQNN